MGVTERPGMDWGPEVKLGGSKRPSLFSVVTTPVVFRIHHESLIYQLARHKYINFLPTTATTLPPSTLTPLAAPSAATMFPPLGPAPDRSWARPQAQKPQLPPSTPRRQPPLRRRLGTAPSPRPRPWHSLSHIWALSHPGTFPLSAPCLG
jgi:hypothetical protein